MGPHSLLLIAFRKSPRVKTPVFEDIEIRVTRERKANSCKELVANRILNKHIEFQERIREYSQNNILGIETTHVKFHIDTAGDIDYIPRLIFSGQLYKLHLELFFREADRYQWLK